MIKQKKSPRATLVPEGGGKYFAALMRKDGLDIFSQVESAKNICISSFLPSFPQLLPSV